MVPRSDWAHKTCAGAPPRPCGPVTEGSVVRLLAVAEPDLLGLHGDVPDRPALHDLVQVQELTGQVTQWLLSSGQATTTPGVGTPSLHCQLVRLHIIIYLAFLWWGAFKPSTSRKGLENGGGLLLPPLGGEEGCGVKGNLQT